MYVVCGDRHWQYASKDPVTGVKEYSVGPSSNEHAGGWKQTDIRPEHLFLNVEGGFLSGTVERKDGAPFLTFRHYNVSGEVQYEEVLELK